MLNRLFDILKGRSLWVTFFVLFFCSVVVHGQRVVSLSPSVTELICDIGGEALLVGRTSYCRELKVDVVGDVLNVNTEKILALKPDVVIAVGFLKVSVAEKLRKLGLRVVVYDTPRSFDAICEQAEEIGRIVGLGEAVIQMVSSERERVSILRKGIKRQGKTMFFQVGVRPLFSVVPNTYMQEFIDYVGCRNISDVSMPSREYVISQRPDYVVMTSMGGLYKEEVEIWRRLTNARVMVVSDEVACCPTPKCYRMTLEEMSRQMREE